MIERHQVLAELERIESSTLFRAASQQKAVLRFMVEQTLAGNLIKGHEIAERALKRKHGDGDAAAQARVIAGKVRRTLIVYYESEGRLNPLRIVIPEKTFVPNFEMLRNGSSVDNNILTTLDRALDAFRTTFAGQLQTAEGAAPSRLGPLRDAFKGAKYHQVFTAATAIKLEELAYTDLRELVTILELVAANDEGAEEYRSDLVALQERISARLVEISPDNIDTNRLYGDVVTKKAEADIERGDLDEGSRRSLIKSLENMAGGLRKFFPARRLRGFESSLRATKIVEMMEREAIDEVLAEVRGLDLRKAFGGEEYVIVLGILAYVFELKGEERKAAGLRANLWDLLDTEPDRVLDVINIAVRSSRGLYGKGKVEAALELVDRTLQCFKERSDTVSRFSTSDTLMVRVREVHAEAFHAGVLYALKLDRAAVEWTPFLRQPVNL